MDEALTSGLLTQWAEPARYGFPVEHGGLLAIGHCPWCGVALPGQSEVSGSRLIRAPKIDFRGVSNGD